MNLNEATTQYDAAFRSVSGLVWLPWVGQRFPSRSPQQRLLVVAESHYTIQSTPEALEAVRKQHLQYPTYTREVVSECLVNSEWPNRTLDTLPKLLFKSTEIDAPRLWGDTAYYNIVQRLMDYYRQPVERPTWNDFVEGWRVFAEVVRIIQPSHCLFIGVEAANSFNYAMTSQNVTFINVSRTQRVSRTWARTAKLELAGMTTELMFVQHAAKYFSWNKWHDHLQAQHADFMNWLGAESYANTRNA